MRQIDKIAIKKWRFSSFSKPGDLLEKSACKNDRLQECRSHFQKFESDEEKISLDTLRQNDIIVL